MAWFFESVTLTGINTRLLSTRKSAPTAAQANRKTTPIGTTVITQSPLGYESTRLA
jgi:hypothetical protein